jgi:hypothetical protein
MTVVREHGVETMTEPVKAGWVEFDTYWPHASPWDYYARKHQWEIRNVLAAVGVDCYFRHTNQRILHPVGTGPRGRIRFGDDMMPGVYHVDVKVGDVEKAKAAMTVHEEAVQRWLERKAPMPEACRT